MAPLLSKWDLGILSLPRPACCNRVVSGSFHTLSQGAFQLSLTLLVRYRSGATYLALAVDSAIFPCPIQGTVLFLVPPILLHLRGSHPLWRSVPGNFGSENGWSPPHLPLHCCKGIRLGLPGFQSPLLTGCLLVSFPPPTKMLHFGGLLHLLCKRCTAEPTDQRLLAATRGFSQLDTQLCGLQPSHPLRGVATYPTLASLCLRDEHPSSFKQKEYAKDIN